MVKRINWLCIY